jgi:hypothetical protein
MIRAVILSIFLDVDALEIMEDSLPLISLRRIGPRFNLRRLSPARSCQRRHTIIVHDPTRAVTC